MGCVRCKRHDVESSWNDLRTLRMSCLYDMSELDVPFHVVEELDYPHKREFALQVCKPCRADWMFAIEKWFKYMEKTND